VVVTKDGYHSADSSFGEECGTGRSLKMSLTPTSNTTNCCTAVMSLHVEDSVHQDMNLQGATVTIRIDGSTQPLRSGTTTDGGNFTSDQLCGQTTYIVTITKDGYTTKSVAMQFTDCHTYTETILLHTH
jgi:hypothetical protein